MNYEFDPALPPGWFIANGRAEPTPEEINRRCEEIRSTWTRGDYARARGMTVDDLLREKHWEPHVVNVPPPRKPPSED